MITKKISNIRRRNRPNGKRNNFSRNNSFEKNTHRPKGSVPKVLEKYLTLAQDAASNGDRIKAEGYFQHAEHFQRLMNAITVENEKDGGVNNEKKPQENNKLSRTERASIGTSERLNKEINNNDVFDNREKDSSFTNDGVEALKAFSSPITQSKNKEN